MNNLIYLHINHLQGMCQLIQVHKCVELALVVLRIQCLLEVLLQFLGTLSGYVGVFLTKFMIIRHLQI